MGRLVAMFLLGGGLTALVGWVALKRHGYPIVRDDRVEPDGETALLYKLVRWGVILIVAVLILMALVTIVWGGISLIT